MNIIDHHTKKTNADEIRSVHEAIFSGPYGYSDSPHDILIAASNLVEF